MRVGAVTRAANAREKTPISTAKPRRPRRRPEQDTTWLETTRQTTRVAGWMAGLFIARTAHLTRTAATFLFFPPRPRRLIATSLIVGLLVVGGITLKRHGVHTPSSAASPSRTAALSLGSLSSRCGGPRALIPPPGSCGDAQRVVEAPNPNAAIIAPPSISIDAIEHALSGAGSPLAANTVLHGKRTYAEYIWDKGKAVGVDPAVMMAFFNQESNYGTQGVAVDTHNPGNIRPFPGRGSYCSVYGCYAYAVDWFQGIDDTYDLLHAYATEKGLHTVAQAVPVWAPSSDYNDDVVFITGVRNTMRSLASLG